METTNPSTTAGKEARFLIVKLNNLAERLEREGGLMLSDYTRGMMRNPDRAAGGQVEAMRALSKARVLTTEAGRLADEITETATELLRVTGWPITGRNEGEEELNPSGADGSPQTRQRSKRWDPTQLLRPRRGIRTAAGVLASASR